MQETIKEYIAHMDSFQIIQRRSSYLTEIWRVKNFAKTLPALGFKPTTFRPRLPYRLWPLLACTVGAQLVASTLGDLAAAAIATVSVSSNHTQQSS